MTMPVTRDDIDAAMLRIRGRVRETPVIRTEPLSQPIAAGRLLLKLENLQVSGSFKARGATNTILSLDKQDVARGLITASGGNHGLGLAASARAAGAAATIYLPTNTPKAKAEKLTAWGAKVVFEGAVWDQANAAALAAADRDGLTYVHPFARPSVIAGQGTVGFEIMNRYPEIDTVVVAIGGGGLISGVATAVKAMKPEARVIGAEPTGAATLHGSIEAGRLVELAEIATAANSLAPRKSEQINLDIITRWVDHIVLVSDAEMLAAARWLWFELGQAVELSAAAGIAALMTGRLQTSADENVCVVICGAGTDGLAP